MSTFFTLFLVPAVFSLMLQVRASGEAWFRRRLHIETEVEGGVG